MPNKGIEDVCYVDSNGNFVVNSSMDNVKLIVANDAGTTVFAINPNSTTATLPATIAGITTLKATTGSFTTCKGTTCTFTTVKGTNFTIATLAATSGTFSDTCVVQGTFTATTCALTRAVITGAVVTTATVTTAKGTTASYTTAKGTTCTFTTVKGTNAYITTLASAGSVKVENARYIRHRHTATWTHATFTGGPAAFGMTNFTAAQCNDGKVSTKAWDGPTKPLEVVTLDKGVGAQARYIADSIAFRNSAAANSYTMVGRVRYSSDGTAWTTAIATTTFALASGSQAFTSFDFTTTPATGKRYYRFFHTGTSTGSGGVSEIQLQKKAHLQVTATAPTQMGGWGAVLPRYFGEGTATADIVGASGLSASEAKDGFTCHYTNLDNAKNYIVLCDGETWFMVEQTWVAFA